jgi:hypothetical protein
MEQDNLYAHRPEPENNNMDKLLSGLKAEDNWNMKLTRNLQWFYWIMVPVYELVYFVIPDAERTILDRFSGACYILGFLMFAFAIRSLYKDYLAVDYALPTVVMLQKAIKRYKLFQWKTAWVIPPVLLVDAGVSLSHFNETGIAAPWQEIVKFQYFFIPAILVSFCIGVAIWYKRQKPLRDNAKKLLEEIQQGNGFN